MQFVDPKGPTTRWGTYGGVDLDRMPKLNTSHSCILIDGPGRVHLMSF